MCIINNEFCHKKFPAEPDDMDSNIYCHKPNIIIPSAFSTLSCRYNCVFIAMNYYIRRRQMRRMGMMSSNTGGGGFGSLFGGSGGVGINYVCIACGQRFKGGSCPRCGSKMKRADF